MKKKVIVIGKNSFISRNLYKYLKKKIKIKVISYRDFIKQPKVEDVDYIINCSSTREYVQERYNSKYDLDLRISKKIINLKKCKLIFLSSRKIYKPSNNIKESGKILPKENYSKNKYISEKKLVRVLKNRILVLRISNLIGLYNNNKVRKLHKTFIDYFLENIKKNIIFQNNKLYKDFLPINIFSQIVFLLIKKNRFGIFNVSMGRKVYLNTLVRWLNYYNSNKVIILNMPKNTIKGFNKDTFYLNNDKLLKSINIKFDLNDLKKECLRISKKIFYAKKK